MPWNIFKKTLSEEEKAARKLQREAFEKGRSEAKKEKLRKKIAKAHKAGYKKEMKGQFGELKDLGKSAFKIGNKIVDVCGEFAYGIEPPKKKTKKRRR